MMNGSVDDSTECWKIVHIPENPPVLPHLQATVDVLASAIEAKHANTIVRKLNHIAPLEGLRHVKRIRKTCLDGGKSQLFVILCKASGNDGDSNYMPEDVLELVNMYQLSTFTTKVVNAVVIVDPSTRQVIASSHDQVLSCDSLRTSTCRESSCSKQPQATNQYDSSKIEKDPMLLIKCSSNEAKQSYKNVSCLHPWGWLEQQSHLSSDSWHPLGHAAIVAIENSAARDRRFFPGNAQHAEFAQEAYNVSSPTGSPLKRQKVMDDEQMDCHKNGLRCDSSRPYLCTGYDIYFVWEPCVIESDVYFMPSRTQWMALWEVSTDCREREA